MDFIEIAPSKLVHDPENPRKHGEDNLVAIRSSILSYGQVEPLVVQRSTKMVIAGNARLRVLKDLGYKTVKVVMLDVDDTEARKLSIALNRSGELAEWNEDVLAKHLEELTNDLDFDSLTVGFSQDDMEELVNAFGGTIESLDFAPPEEEKNWDDSEEDSSEEMSYDPESIQSNVTNVRMVQLFMNDDTIEPFQAKVRALSAEYGTQNITDTIVQCVEEAYENLEG